MKKVFILLWMGVTLAGVAGAEDTPAQTVLKRALVGAVTGATATSMSNKPATNFQPDNPAKETPAAFAAAKDDASGRHGKKHKKNKKGHRPPGWDKGKKTGWGDSDVPPGLAKKND